MNKLRHIYRDRIVDSLERVVTGQAEAFDAASAAVAKALAADRIVFVAGSGHSHLIAEEAFFRAGGIAAAQAILDPGLMLHESASRSSRLEREAGYAVKVLAGYDIQPGDVVFIASNSGRNAYPIEVALEARTRGATTVALTSMAHTTEVTSRHATGKRLFEVCDIVLDNGAAYGDASLAVGDGTVRMGPTSTVVGVFIINAVIAEAVDDLSRRGIAVDVYQSANSQGGEAAAEDMVRRWKSRIKAL